MIAQQFKSYSSSLSDAPNSLKVIALYSQMHRMTTKPLAIGESPDISPLNIYIFLEAPLNLPQQQQLFN